MTFVRRPGCTYFEGTILQPVQSRHYTVRLDDGRELLAVFPKSRLRRLGCLFGSLAGWRVTIVERPDPLPAAIVDLQRPVDS